MTWLDELTSLDRADLLPAATPEAVARVELALGTSLPNDFREFLTEFADGGFLHERRFLIYSAGLGLHPDETLVANNLSHEADYPLILAGRDASEEFGFQKTDLPCDSCPVYFASHETGDLTMAAESFSLFAARITGLRPGEPLRLRRRADRRGDGPANGDRRTGERGTGPETD